MGFPVSHLSDEGAEFKRIKNSRTTEQARPEFSLKLRLSLPDVDSTTLDPEQVQSGEMFQLSKPQVCACCNLVAVNLGLLCFKTTF